jgi:hypothetical protein
MLATLIFRDGSVAAIIDNLISMLFAFIVGAVFTTATTFVDVSYKLVIYLYEFDSYLRNTFDRNIFDAGAYFLFLLLSLMGFYLVLRLTLFISLLFVSVRNYAFYYRYSKRVPNLSLPAKVYEFVSDDIKKESAYLSNTYYSNDKCPKGVFMIFLCEKDLNSTPTFAGHGFAIDNQAYTAHHVVSVAETNDLLIYAAKPGGEHMIPITVNKVYEEDLDFCSLGPSSFLSVLGVQSLKVAFPQSGLVTVYNYDGSQYLGHTVAVEPMELTGTPHLLYTKSNTTSGCSGMPVLQKGKVVAFHVGSNSKIKRNAHAIPTALLRATVDKLASRRQTIFGLESVVGTYSSSDNGDVERAREIKRLDQEWKEARMKGEHTDDQGFRAKTTTRLPLKPTFKGKDWNDIEEESPIVDSLGNIEDVLNSDDPDGPTPEELRKMNQAYVLEREAKQKQALAELALKHTDSLKAKAPLGAPEVPSTPPIDLQTLEITALEKLFREAGRVYQSRRQHLQKSDTSSTKPTEKTNSGEKAKPRSKKSKASNPVSDNPSKPSTTPPAVVQLSETDLSTTLKELLKQELAKLSINKQ